jgi:hypothetical protein
MYTLSRANDRESFLSSVNAKFWMAITGSGLLVFVIGHMLGNLQIYLGPATLKGGLRLDSESGIREGGDTGPIIIAGKPAESLLIKALRHEELQMPPDSRLADDVLDHFST